MTSQQTENEIESDLWAPVMDREGLVRQLQASIVRNPNIFGAADIYNLTFLEPLVRAGMLAAVLTGLVDSDRRPAVCKFVIVVPYGADQRACDAKAWAEVVATFSLLSQQKMDPREQEWVRGRLEVIVTPDRRTRSVLDIISAQPERTVVFITEAANYRDDDVAPYVAPGAPTQISAQDVWVPQLHSLASSAIAIARERLLYIAVDSDRFSPSRKTLCDLLLSIDGCGVLGSTGEDDLDSVLLGRVDQWNAWIGEGRLGAVFRDIEHLPAEIAVDKPYLRIQILHRAGLYPIALKAIREEISANRKLTTSSRVKLARIAQDANASKLAAEILEPAVDKITDREDLESALSTAYDAGLIDIEENVAARLSRMFPESPGLRQRHRRALLAARDYAALSAMAAEDIGGCARAEFYSSLGRFLTTSEVPDYCALIASAKGDIALADAYRMASANDALERNLILHAFELAMPIPKTPAQEERGEKMLLRTLEQTLLANDRGYPLISNERLHAAILSLIERLAANPGNQTLRLGLIHLVQPSVAGTAGLALLAFLLLKLASRPLSLETPRPSGSARADWFLEHNHFLAAAFEWLKSENPVVMGRSVMPESVMTEPADEVISAVEDYFVHAPFDSEADVSSLIQYLALATSVTKYSSDADCDLRLMRLGAGRLATSGHAQPARDVVEQALQSSGSTPRRRRMGWFAMADVYHRCHNHLEALLAACCMLSAHDAGSPEDVWQEIVGIARLLRDCGLHDQARSVVAQARQLISRAGLSNANGVRLETLELQIRQMAISMDKDCGPQIKILLADVLRNGAAVLQCHDTTEPVAIMLGQLLRQAREMDVSIPADADEIFSQLCARATGSFKSKIATMSASEPSADELFKILSISGAARYSDDVGYDMLNVALVARRAITSDTFLASAVNTSFALELMSDRGVACPGWDEVAEPPPPLTTLDETAEILCALSQDSISIVQAGFDHSGRLIRVSAVSGNLERPVREPDEVISLERLEHWATDYPYAYGVDENTTNLFYTTTADLRFSSLPTGPVVLVADAQLQAFPPNLLFVDGEFAGRTRPMTAAPSIGWLTGALAKGSIGDGRHCAWISTAIGDSESQTLSMIADRLAPTFDEYGFVVDNGPALPAMFAGASMAIITAHGGVHPEGRYFQVVSDEGSLRVTARDLADALRNIDIVILFVCSGGRSDKHPAAQTTLGLTKQILDRGCNAVVASPWPLDSRVPSHWLPEFLSKWFQGERIAEAVFAANQVVDRNFAQDPARGLAMTIFGNPFLRRT